MTKKAITAISMISMIALASLAVYGLAFTMRQPPMINVDEATNDRFGDRFLELYDIVVTNGIANGYLSPDGVPYHAIETMCVEAPDYGHETTSEAFSYYLWMAALYGKMTGDWTSYKHVWDLTEQYIIPTQEMQPITANQIPSAGYCPEMEEIIDYPVTSGILPQQGYDPLYEDMKLAYTENYTANGITSQILPVYQMHWLLDVDNVYGFGNMADGVSNNSYINNFARGPSESVWDTIVTPSWEEFTWGAQPGGYLPVTIVQGSNPAKQFKYSSAGDADARQVQIAYWANQWATEQGKANEISDYTQKAVKMGDWLRYTMFDKYFRPLGVEDDINAKTTKANSYDSASYLIGWYTAWGGSASRYPNGDIRNTAWNWKIGSSNIHQGYQNPMTAHAMATTLGELSPTQNSSRDWKISQQRQIELFKFLQSKEGAIAGGVTNSWNGRYEAYPENYPTFYGMAYDPHPVWDDPPSNNWFGFQAWAMERVIEYYYETNDLTAKQVVDKWVNWVVSNTNIVRSFYPSKISISIPITLEWSGLPEPFSRSYNHENPNLSAKVSAWGEDLGVAASIAKSLIYYAAAKDRYRDQDLHTVMSSIELARNAKVMAMNLLDFMWNRYSTDLGFGTPQKNTDFTKFNKQTYVPPAFENTFSPLGVTYTNGMTFLDQRPFYQNDPNYGQLQTYLNTGESKDAPVITYHRFWAQAEIATAMGLFHEFFGGTPKLSVMQHKIYSKPSTSTEEMKLSFIIINDGIAPADLSELTLRYYFDNDGCSIGTMQVDTISAGTGLNSVICDLSTYSGTKSYLDIRFNPATTVVPRIFYGDGFTNGILPGFSLTGDINMIIRSDPMFAFDETNDYSIESMGGISYTGLYSLPAYVYVNSEKMTIYYKGMLIWGKPEQ